jgi:general stress protein CsbA
MKTNKITIKDSDNLATFIGCLIVSLIIIFANAFISYMMVLLFSKVGQPFYVFLISNIILNAISFSFVIWIVYSEYEEISKKYEEEFGGVRI